MKDAESIRPRWLSISFFILFSSFLHRSYKFNKFSTHLISFHDAPTHPLAGRKGLLRMNFHWFDHIFHLIIIDIVFWLILITPISWLHHTMISYYYKFTTHKFEYWLCVNLLMRIDGSQKGMGQMALSDLSLNIWCKLMQHVLTHHDK